MAPADIARIKERLYARALARPEELASAAHAWRGGWPEEEELPELLDFFVIEWVDGDGLTEVERAVADGDIPADTLRWPREVRTALWVVDGWEGPLVLIRDIRTEAEIAVTAPGQAAHLPPRTVLRARVIPTGGTWAFSGAPDIYEGLGVVGRLDLLRGWDETPEPDAIARLAALRAAFLRQREEREAFVAWFGTDLLVAADAADLDRKLAAFVHYLLHTHPFPSLAGRTRAHTFRSERGAEPVIVQVALGASLTGPGRPGVIYDAREGIHFLPELGEFLDHLAGKGSHPGTVSLYLDDPGITDLPFRRAGLTPALATHLGVPDEELATVLAAAKPPRERAIPSLLPSFQEDSFLP